MKIKTKKQLKDIAKKRALKALSNYIRNRDNWTCFTCGKKGDKYNMDAGHLFSRRFSALLFNESNVFCQCVHCNKYLSGNLHVYIERFKKQFGEKEYEKLNFLRQTLIKRTTTDFLLLEKYFKNKLNEL